MKATFFTSYTYYERLMDYWHTVSLKHSMQTVYSADELLMVHQRSKISKLYMKALGNTDFGNQYKFS